MICFIKTTIPLFNYDGEPSVSNGILYQLPSSHLFIHWVPTKLSNRVMPYGVNYRQLQLLFVFDSYRPTAFFKKTDFQWTLSLVSAVGLVGDAVHFTLHPDLRVSYSQPCSISRRLSGIQQGSGYLNAVLFLCYLH